MVYGSPTSNRIQIYFWKDFYCPNQVLAVQISIQGFLENLIYKILFGQNIFARNCFYVLHTWHDHWAEVLDQGEGV